MERLEKPIFFFLLLYPPWSLENIEKGKNKGRKREKKRKEERREEKRKEVEIRNC